MRLYTYLKIIKNFFLDLPVRNGVQESLKATKNKEFLKKKKTKCFNIKISLVLPFNSNLSNFSWSISPMVCNSRFYQ
jgi:hypothetical protein